MGHLTLLRSDARGAVVSGAAHLSVEELASMIDGSLPEHDRDRAERHLAECDSCREELAASARVIATSVSAPVRRFPWRYLLPLAAGILLAVWIRRPVERQHTTDVAQRAAPTTGTRILTVSPAVDAAVDASSLRFAWHPMEGSLGYRVVVKDASGATVWRGDVVDTVLALPDSVRLQPSVSYVWRVDGERADGSSAASTESGFSIAP